MTGHGPRHTGARLLSSWAFYVTILIQSFQHMNKEKKTFLIKVCGICFPLLLLSGQCFISDSAAKNRSVIGSATENDTSYLDPPRVIMNPSETKEYSVETRAFTGISSLAVSQNGRLWVTWYAGETPGEDENNYVVVSTSGDQGETWEEVLVIDSWSEMVRSFDPEIWIDPDGKLWVFWAQATYIGGTWRLIEQGTRAGVWALTTKNPDDADPEWSEPRRLTDGVMMCKPTVLSDGIWALPVSIWEIVDENAQMVISKDRGKTWEVRGGATVPRDARRFDEHMIVERKDGSLWMLIRTLYGIGQSISQDRGNTWSPVIPSPIQHPSARFFIRRLNSGNLLLVKHGPIDMRTQRSHLMAFISRDDGHSWSDGLLLDERRGISYPDGQQSSDGTIYITYDYDRRGHQHILMTRFTEDDVIMRSDRKLLEVYQNRRVVSQGGKQ